MDHEIWVVFPETGRARTAQIRNDIRRECRKRAWGVQEKRSIETRVEGRPLQLLPGVDAVNLYRRSHRVRVGVLYTGRPVVLPRPGRARKAEKTIDLATFVRYKAYAARLPATWGPACRAVSMPTSRGAERSDVRTVAIRDVFRFTSFGAGVPIWTLHENGVGSTKCTAPGPAGGTTVTCRGVLDRDPFTEGTCFMWLDTHYHPAFTGTSRCKEMPKRSRRQPSAGRYLGISTLRRMPIREAGRHTRGKSDRKE